MILSSKISIINNFVNFQNFLKTDYYTIIMIIMTRQGALSDDAV